MSSAGQPLQRHVCDDPIGLLPWSGRNAFHVKGRDFGVVEVTNTTVTGKCNSDFCGEPGHAELLVNPVHQLEGTVSDCLHPKRITSSSAYSMRGGD